MKYRFTVWYQTPNLRQVNEFMINLDVFVKDTVVAFKEVYEFNYTGSEKPISYFKDLIKQAMESVGNKVVNCEGGPIE